MSWLVSCCWTRAFVNIVVAPGSSATTAMLVDFTSSLGASAYLRCVFRDMSALHSLQCSFGPAVMPLKRCDAELVMVKMKTIWDCLRKTPAPAPEPQRRAGSALTCLWPPLKNGPADFDSLGMEPKGFYGMSVASVSSPSRALMAHVESCRKRSFASAAKDWPHPAADRKLLAAFAR